VSVAAYLAYRAAWGAAIDGADRVIHLAALPGGAAEADPQASRRINLDLLLDLLDLLAGAGKSVRLVHASSIAVFGHPLPTAVDDDTVPRPSSTYGTHKRMAELALDDAARRGDLDTLSLRLPGIVARPRAAAGFKSAFISDVFAAMRAGEPCTLPVGPDASLWLMSARRCADNLLHAAGRASSADGQSRAVTLPAIRASMADLVDVLACVCGGDRQSISYAPDPAIEAQFGRLPPLRTPRAEALGFHDDGGLHALVRAATGHGA
jgi:D-erythronate 2-dehydrogenase